MQTQTTLSAHFPDRDVVKLVIAAAKRSGKTPSAFIRDAAIAEAAKQAGKCPTCGHAHAKKRAA